MDPTGRRGRLSASLIDVLNDSLLVAGGVALFLLLAKNDWSFEDFFLKNLCLFKNENIKVFNIDDSKTMESFILLNLSCFFYSKNSFTKSTFFQ